MLGNFTIKYFKSNDELINYIEQPEYGLAESPAVCFGFKIIENSNTNYEIELFFNDLDPRYLMSLPDQKQQGADPNQQNVMF